MLTQLKDMFNSRDSFFSKVRFRLWIEKKCDGVKW